MASSEGRRKWPPAWRDIVDPAVLTAIGTVPRDRFVPQEQRGDAFEDIPLPIGHGQTISQPYIVALMTQALDLTPTSRVLEVGTGSGYQAAILAAITPLVWSIESIVDLANSASTLLRRNGYAVQIKHGDGYSGWEENAPFDAIIVTAAAREVPPALASQLAVGGRMVIPVGLSTWDQILWRIDRTPDGFRVRALAGVRFVPLISDRSNIEDEDPELTTIRRQLRLLMDGF